LSRTATAAAAAIITTSIKASGMPSFSEAKPVIGSRYSICEGCGWTWCTQLSLLNGSTARVVKASGWGVVMLDPDIALGTATQQAAGAEPGLAVSAVTRQQPHQQCSLYKDA